MKAYYSCLLDSKPKFYKQCFLLVHSLIELANVPPQHIWVHFTNDVDEMILQQLQALKIQLFEIERFGDERYCNKIAQLSNKNLHHADLVVLMDTDMIVTKPFIENVSIDCVNGKIVDLANPDINVLEDIFQKAGIERTLGRVKTDISKEETLKGNFNGGLYIIPKKYMKTVNESWRKWALWLLEKKHLHKAGKGIHVDQVSFCMTLHENKLPIEHLNRKYNMPTHLSFYKDVDPYILHYHDLLTSNGLLPVDPHSSNAYKNTLEKVNSFIHSSYRKFNLES
ncbi:hypothetical protein LC087_07025 [Bacillus carboniphilus]|uniref:Glycosyltransferase n=1 Tax=Bacillus carboniphilus TaxID=86663 RepID=A0ABY9JWT4_9BACI|nr:hypothetical protein [Bacillus carboniphilus]WLR43867.1 hypothetical protein LC087_07025 [Bacillus carboniphilus]